MYSSHTPNIIKNIFLCTITYFYIIIVCISREEELFRGIDYRPASTVLITGAALVNKFKVFLTDYNKTVAATGQLAQIPPTLVSRSPFRCATLNRLEVR